VRHAGTMTVRLPTLVVALAVGTALGVLSGLVLVVPVRHLLDPGHGRAVAVPSPQAVRVVDDAGREPPAARVLQAWDRRRAAAYANGSARALRAAYVPGSRAGVADVALLRAYRDRGWRVVGMRTQVLALTVLEHAPGRWRLRVTDRLAGGVAVRLGERVSLPRDRASTHVITLTRGPGRRWRVAAVRAAD
jgi:hypothetical protein